MIAARWENSGGSVPDSWFVERSRDVRAFRADHWDGSGPLKWLSLKSTLLRLATSAQAAGREPTKLYEPRFTDVGTPEMQPTPGQIGEQGSLPEVQPVRPAAAQLSAVTLDCSWASAPLAVTGGG